MREQVFILCALCRSREATEVYRDVKNRVVMCEDCTLVYLNPRLTDAAYRAYYDHEYQRRRHGVRTYDEAIARLQQKGTYERKKERYLESYRPYLQRESRVLEVGSSWGAMLAVLRDHVRCAVHGIEISALAAEVSEKHFRVPVSHQTFEEYVAGAPERRFDFVILHHVIEHATDPLRMLLALQNVVEPSGHLAIALPNMAVPDEPLDRYFRLEHCAYFTPFTLAEALRRTGWKIVDLKEMPYEMRVIAVRAGVANPEVDVSKFAEVYNANRIRRVIARENLRYGVLRALKRTMTRMLPARALEVARTVSVRLLRRIGAIKS